MNFTGAELTKKRNFYTQNNNGGFALDFYVTTATGRYQFGISGASSSFDFILESGKISQNGQFLHHYFPYERVYLEAQYTRSGFNLIKDSSPLVMNGPKTSGDYNYFYFTRPSANVNADFNLTVSGANLPNYTISNLGALSNSGQSEVTGTITNNGAYGIKLFGGQAQSLQGLTFVPVVGTIGPGGVSTFKYTGSFSGFDFTLPILSTFNTNFEDKTVNFQISDARTYQLITVLQSINFGFNASNQLQRTVYYQTFSGNNTVIASQQLTLSLQYVSGSGTFSVNTILDTGIFGSGVFDQTGNWTGNYSIPAFISGNSGTFTGQFFETGYAEGPFFIVYTGAGSGSISGVITTGLFTGLLSGLIFSGNSGLFIQSGRYEGKFVASSSGVGIGVKASGVLDFRGMRYGDMLTFGFSSGDMGNYGYAWGTFFPNVNNAVRADPTGTTLIDDGDITFIYPGIPFVENTGLVVKRDDPWFFYGSLGNIMTGTALTSGQISVQAITGGYIGNAANIYLMSGSSGMISGSNCVTGFGMTGFLGMTGALSYNAIFTLTGGENGFATGYIRATGSFPGLYNPTFLINVPWQSGFYGSAVVVDSALNNTLFFSQIVNRINGETERYRMTAVLSGSNAIFFTCTESGAKGNQIRIMSMAGSVSSGFYSGTNRVQTVGTTGWQDYNRIKFKAYVQMAGGVDAGSAGIVNADFTGTLLNYYKGTGPFSSIRYGLKTGVFTYTRTFIDAWDLQTGFTVATLASCKIPGKYSSGQFTGTALFPPGSMVFQVNHQQNLLNAESARLNISGANVLVPITGLLSN